MKYLVIAEKPSVARSISKVIGAYKHEDGYHTKGLASIQLKRRNGILSKTLMKQSF